MTIFMLGFAIGMGLTYLIFQILYRVLLFGFKIKGKKHNLLTVKCIKCKSHFYIFNYETKKLCCNCILLNIEKK